MNKHQQRRAYTLIELLVVISLMAILAALTITFMPNFASSQKESRSAMNVQTWLNIAKQKALRNQATGGVRFTVTSGTFGSATTVNNICTDAQYLEQPEDFSGGSIFSPNPAPAGYSRTNCLVVTSDLTNGYAPVNLPNPYNTNDSNRIFWNVQPGDYLEVLGTGLVRQITQVGLVVGGNVNSSIIIIDPPLGYPIDQPTQNFRIVRAPRPVGEDLKMPEGVVIDFGTNLGTYGFSSPLPPITNPSIGSGFVDILFSPSGAVISPGVTTGNINLWIRSPFPGDETNVYRGDPTIISVFVRTGLVGAFPTAQGGNPYSLVY